MDEGPLGLKIFEISLRDQAILEKAWVDGNIREAHENVLGQLRGEVLVEIAILYRDVLGVHYIYRVLIRQVWEEFSVCYHQLLWLEIALTGFNLL